MSSEAMTIIQLDVSNVKRIEALAVRPDGTGLIQVTGPNGSGKSSVLDAIEYALRGGTAPPIRTGKERARVVLDLGELIVRRTWSAKSNQLVVEKKDGSRFAGPQQVLDRLLSRVAFDPLEFTRQKPEQQAATLRALVGLDTRALDGRRATLYEERTLVNRDRKRVEALLNERLPSEPVEPVSVDALVAQMAEHRKIGDQRRALQRKREDKQRLAAGLEQQIQGDEEAIEQLKQKIKKLQARIDGARGDIDKAVKADAALEFEQDQLKGGTETEIQAIEQKMRDAADVNARVAYHAETERLRAELGELNDRQAKIVAGMEKIDDEKAKTLANVKMPIEELSVDDAGVKYRGVPLADASTAEQIAVSAAIGMAMQPTLRVMLVREGSLMDQAHREALRAQAMAAGVQVWYERVSDAQDATVTIVEATPVETDEPNDEQT